jgi:hypothetical protein
LSFLSGFDSLWMLQRKEQKGPAVNLPRLLPCPQTLLEGQAYLLSEKGQNEMKAMRTLVTFVAYTSCPAMVVVQSSDGKRRRCPREGLVEMQGLVHYVKGKEEMVRG